MQRTHEEQLAFVKEMQNDLIEICWDYMLREEEHNADTK